MKAPVALVFALALTGCDSGGNGPTATAAPSVTASSASPDATASADLKTVLDRVVREYYAEANRALATGDVRGLTALSTEQCSCRRLVKYIEDKYRAGSLRGAVFQLKTVRPYQVEPTRAVVQVTHDAPAYDVLDRAGQRIETVPADPGNKEDLYLRLLGDRWLVENLVTL